MQLSSKLFLVSRDGELHSLAASAFMRMLRQQSPCRLPDLASQRLRQASLAVELVNRVPIRVVHQTFSVLDIDADGRLDVKRLTSQKFARVDDWMATTLTEPTTTSSVIDAGSRFIARGGSWQPDDQLMRRIEAAALGRLKCQRARVAA
jgi:hypothetical protein